MGGPRSRRPLFVGMSGATVPPGSAARLPGDPGSASVANTKHPPAQYNAHRVMLSSPGAPVRVRRGEQVAIMMASVTTYGAALNR